MLTSVTSLQTNQKNDHTLITGPATLSSTCGCFLFPLYNLQAKTWGDVSWFFGILVHLLPRIASFLNKGDFPCVALVPYWTLEQRAAKTEFSNKSTAMTLKDWLLPPPCFPMLPLAHMAWVLMNTENGGFLLTSVENSGDICRRPKAALYCPNSH